MLSLFTEMRENPLWGIILSSDPRHVDGSRSINVQRVCEEVIFNQEPLAQRSIQPGPKASTEDRRFLQAANRMWKALSDAAATKYLSLRRNGQRGSFIAQLMTLLVDCLFYLSCCEPGDGPI